MLNKRTVLQACAAGLACLIFGGLCVAADDTKATKTEPRRENIESEQFEMLTPVPVTRSVKRRIVTPVPKFPPDGSTVSARSCRLVKEPAGQWYLLKFEPVKGKKAEPPRRVLPCRLLEEMQKTSKKTPKTIFKLWGENTNYKNRCYLLPISVAVVRKDSLVSAPATAPAKKPQSKPAAATTKPKKEKPAAGVDDVMQELLREKPAKPIVVPAGEEPKAKTKKPVKSVAPKTGDALPAERGQIVVDRLVRIVAQKDGKWLLARFESDNTLRQPPLKLLPCSLLQKAEAWTRKDKCILKISGRITHYEGERYLLLRKILRHHELGRF